jgi:hypothetical protein
LRRILLDTDYQAAGVENHFVPVVNLLYTNLLRYASVALVKEYRRARHLRGSAKIQAFAGKMASEKCRRSLRQYRCGRRKQKEQTEPRNVVCKHDCLFSGDVFSYV